MWGELIELLVRSVVYAVCSFALLGLFGLLVDFLGGQESGARVM